MIPILWFVIYHIDETSIFNTRCYYVDEQAVPDGDYRDMKRVLVLRDDLKFAIYEGKIFRCCQVEIEDDDDQRFVKVWVNDPFKGFDDYEQIEDIVWEMDNNFSYVI